MDEIYNCLIHKHGLAFGIGTVTLLLTIFLVSRHIIGFTLSVLLLLIGLGGSYGFEHQDFVKTYWYKFIHQLSPKTSLETTSRRSEAVQPSEQTIHQPQERQFDSEQSVTPPKDAILKGQTERQKQRSQRFINTHAPEQ